MHPPGTKLLISFQIIMDLRECLRHLADLAAQRRGEEASRSPVRTIATGRERLTSWSHRSPCDLAAKMGQPVTVIAGETSCEKAGTLGETVAKETGVQS